MLYAIDTSLVCYWYATGMLQICHWYVVCYWYATDTLLARYCARPVIFQLGDGPCSGGIRTVRSKFLFSRSCMTLHLHEHDDICIAFVYHDRSLSSYHMPSLYKIADTLQRSCLNTNDEECVDRNDRSPVEHSSDQSLGICILRFSRRS
jgi:hypothetical protein